MNCNHIQDIIDTFYDKHPEEILNPDTHPEVFRHLEECVTCRVFVEQAMNPLIRAGQIQAPEPPSGMKPRILKLVAPSSSALLNLKTVTAVMIGVLIFIASYRFGTSRISHPGPIRLPDEATVLSSCQFYPDLLPNPAVFLQPVRSVISRPIEGPNQTEMLLPSHLTSHGRYQLDSRQIRLSDTDACIAFVSPLGDSLMLHLRRAPGDSFESEYVVRKDETRVLAYSVSWTRDGWSCTMSGRLPPENLLSLARELAITI